jgi:hypothetical protein
MNYVKTKNLLSTNNAKTVKGEKKGITTYIMYLSPYNQNSKGINLCSHASDGCAKACLFGSGAARFSEVQNGKRNKTEWFLDNRIEFLLQLDSEITKAEKLHGLIEGDEQKKKNGIDVLRYKNFAIRLNGTSDIPFEKFKIRDNKNIFELHPNVQFYDYTKNYVRMRKEMPSNYHLTFSLSETNKKVAFELLSEGKNVAMVFGVKKASNLPTEYEGYKVINGDETDLRFLDENNVIVGLKYKLLTGKGSKGKNDYSENDFIIKVG